MRLELMQGWRGEGRVPTSQQFVYRILLRYPHRSSFRNRPGGKNIRASNLV
jgi:hypothetical protein